MTRRVAMLLSLAVLSFVVMKPGDAAAQKPTRTPILSAPLAKLDIKDAQIEARGGKPRGTLTIAQHFALDPG